MELIEVVDSNQETVCEAIASPGESIWESSGIEANLAF